MASPSASGVSFHSRSETVGSFFSPLGGKTPSHTSFVAVRNVFLQVSCGVFTFLLRRCREGRARRDRADRHRSRTAFRRRRRCKNRDAFSSLSRPPRLWAPPRFSPAATIGLIVRLLRAAVVPAAVPVVPEAREVRAVPADPVPVRADAQGPVSARVPVEDAEF